MNNKTVTDLMATLEDTAKRPKTDRANDATTPDISTLLRDIGHRLDVLAEGDLNGDMHSSAMKSLALFHRIDRALRHQSAVIETQESTIADLTARTTPPEGAHLNSRELRSLVETLRRKGFGGSARLIEHAYLPEVTS